MAIYSNFDGTFKDSVQIGKQGPKIIRDDQNLKITHQDGITPSVLSIGEPSANTHAVTKLYLDKKFGTENAQVRTNLESDQRYQAFIEKNKPNGYVGLGSDGIIPLQYIPPAAVTATYTVHNHEERNTLKVNRGDMVIVLSIPIWKAGVFYKAGTIVAVSEPSVQSKFYFYVAKIDQTSEGLAPSGETPNWGISTFVTGSQQHTIGQEVLFDRAIYISLVNEIHDRPVTDKTKFRLDSYPDSGLYICKRQPTEPNGTTVDDDWAVVDFGAQVQTFNGRTGSVEGILGDYSADLITFTATDDIVGTTVKDALFDLGNKRLKKTGDQMTGTFAIAPGTAMLPSVISETNTKTGMYASLDGAFAFSYNEAEKLRVGPNIVSTTNIELSGKRILNVGEPVSATDVATKQYVDNTPLISQGTTEPALATGKNSDVYFRTKTAGDIKTPFTTVWNSVASDGAGFLAVSSLRSNPIAVFSDNKGDSWNSLDMPSAVGASDVYKAVVSNGPGQFLAIRKIIDTANTNSQLIYTLDSGKTWVSVNQLVFPWSGSYIPVRTSTSSNYVLLSSNGSTAYYSATNGVTWGETTLPKNTTWVAGASVGMKVVAIAADYTTAISSDGGITWVQGGTLPNNENGIYKSIATTNGINFVAISQQPLNQSGNRCAFSNDGGASWSTSQMPEEFSNVPSWAEVNANSSTYIAVAPNVNYVARSIDGGASWQKVSLPTSRGWGKVASTGTRFVVLDVSTSTSTPFVVSSDNGQTWTNTINGGIDNIFVKQGALWLPYRGVTFADGDARYVSKMGDQMTGRLVIDTGLNGYSLEVSGALKANGKIESLAYRTNSSTPSSAGRIDLGTHNQDAVVAGNIHKWSISTDGTNEGYNLRIQSVSRNAVPTVTDRVVFTPTSTILSSPVGLGQVAVGSLLHIDPRYDLEAKNSFSIYAGNGRSNITLLSGGNDTTTDFIKCHSGCTGMNYSSTNLSNAVVTYRVASNGSVFSTPGFVAGFGDVDLTTKYKAYVTGGQRGLVIDSTLSASKAANITAIEIKSRDNMELSDTYSHINVFEGNTNVLWIGKSKAIVMKRVGINTSASDQATLVVGGTDAVQIPTGTSAQRPETPSNGMMRFNSDIRKYEVYENDKWIYVNTGSYNFNIDFVASDWKLLSGTVYQITILAANHNLVTMPYCVFQEKLPNGNYAHAQMYYEVAPSGDITIQVDVNNTIDLPSIRVFVHV